VFLRCPLSIDFRFIDDLTALNDLKDDSTKVLGRVV